MTTSTLILGLNHFPTVVSHWQLPVGRAHCGAEQLLSRTINSRSLTVGCLWAGPTEALRHWAMAEQDLLPSNRDQRRHSNGCLLRAVLILLCYSICSSDWLTINEGFQRWGLRQRGFCPHGVWGLAWWHMEAVWFTNLEDLQTPCFGIFMEASLHSQN